MLWFCVAGVTPSIGLVKQVIKNVEIPTMVLIRCRSGNFTYSKNEKETMLNSMKNFSKFNVVGFVVGALTQSGEVDKLFMEELRSEFDGFSLTFHRAFDFVRDPFRALRDIEQLKFQRILTSGLSDDIIKGKEMIRKLVRLSDHTKIMPGGGITPENVQQIINYTKAKEIHVSASEAVTSKIGYGNKDLSMGSMIERKTFNKIRFEKILNNLRGVSDSE
ncbi:MAG: copper homeostasis protein CutC [Clostridia bacterium]